MLGKLSRGNLGLNLSIVKSRDDSNQDTCSQNFVYRAACWIPGWSVRLPSIEVPVLAKLNKQPDACASPNWARCSSTARRHSESSSTASTARGREGPEGPREPPGGCRSPWPSPHCRSGAAIRWLQVMAMGAEEGGLLGGLCRGLAGGLLGISIGASGAMRTGI